ncbi:hypothetical protein A2U01_0065734, partial [Trifolium medium]|nr:hypothetical protein [Trifolium medium]
MGEDSCLFEEESGSEASQFDCGVGFVDPKTRRNVDLLVNNITERLEDEDYDDVQGMRENEPFDKPEEGEYEEEVERRPTTPSPGYNSVATSSNLRPNPRGG